MSLRERDGHGECRVLRETLLELVPSESLNLTVYIVRRLYRTKPLYALSNGYQSWGLRGQFIEGRRF